MSDPNESTPQGTPTEPVLFGARNAQSEPRNRTPLIVGFVLVVAVVAIIAVMGRGKKEVATSADPYAANLAVEQARLSQANNFIGATITYLDLTVRNNGPRTVMGGAVQAVFHDALGQVVQTEVLPLRALVPHALGGEAEAADLAQAPLGPGQERTLRLTVEHISSQWNQALPDLEFRGLRFR